MPACLTFLTEACDDDDREGDDVGLGLEDGDGEEVLDGLYVGDLVGELVGLGL